MTWGYVAAAAATVVGGAIQSDSARKAANAQKDSTNAALQQTGALADRSYADQQQYRDVGGRALTTLEGEISQPVSAADVLNSPGYQFGQQQGQLGLDRKIAAMGGRVSGRALKAASQFNTDYAATGYGAEYQRRQDRLNRLAALAGIGQTSTQASGATAMQQGNQISNLLTSQGNAQGAAQLSQGNIWANTGNQLAAIYGRNNGGGYSSLVPQGSLVNGGGFQNMPGYMIQGES